MTDCPHPKVRRAKRCRACYFEMVRTDPERKAKLREPGKRMQREHLSRPDVIEKCRTPEVRAKRGKAIADARLPDIPEPYRADYRFLRDKKGLRASEAREIIHQQIRQDNSPTKILDRHYGGKPARAA